MTGEFNSINTYPEENEVLELKQRLKRAHWNILLTSLIIVFMLLCMFQQKNLAEKQQEEAYLVSLVVAEYEDILFFKYQLRPEHIGLEEYRNAWVNNPCDETIFPYYEKLAEIMELLENGTFPENSYNNELSEDPLPC